MSLIETWRQSRGGGKPVRAQVCTGRQATGPEPRPGHQRERPGTRTPEWGPKVCTLISRPEPISTPKSRRTPQEGARRGSRNGATLMPRLLQPGTRVSQEKPTAHRGGQPTPGQLEKPWGSHVGERKRRKTAPTSSRLPGLHISSLNAHHPLSEVGALGPTSHIGTLSLGALGPKSDD